MIREEFSNWDRAELSVLAEKAHVTEALRRHNARELLNESRRGNVRAVVLAIAFAVTAGVILWVG